MYIHNNHCHQVTAHLQLNILYYYVLLNMPFGWYPSIILVSSSIFQSITVSGFTMSLSSNTVLCTTSLCIFLKRSIQPSKARKPRRAATCRPFYFKWGPSMDALAVRACLNNAERKVSGSSSDEVFRDLGSLKKR